MEEKITIPSINREEWGKMITGKIKHQYQNYVLQIQLNSLKRQVSNQEISLKEAIKQIYDLSLKYALAVQSDFKQIFKAW